MAFQNSCFQIQELNKVYETAKDFNVLFTITHSQISSTNFKSIVRFKYVCWATSNPQDVSLHA